MMDVERAMDGLAEHLDYPMFIVTAQAGERRGGCLVGFCTQCSVSPALYAVFISHNNFTHGVAVEAEALGIHVVPREREDLARLFGEATGDETDKFDLCEWRRGPLDAPVLPSCKDWFVGRILERIEVGDHTGFVVEPVEAAAEGGSFFPFSRADRFEPGHEA